MATPRYRYQGLPQSREPWFRLIELQSSANEQDFVIVKLRVVLLDKAPPFEAISYCWGGSTTKIECDDAELEITSNLHDILRRLRSKTVDRLYWADAVCIDQSNLDERGQQVQLMGRIYWQAEKVNAWLGQDDGSAEEAFDLVRHTVRFFREQETKYGTLEQIPHFACLPYGSDDAWRSLSKILAKPLFRRAWIAQEIGMATKCDLICGIHTIEKGQLTDMAWWITRRAYAIIPTYEMKFDWRSIWQMFEPATRGYTGPPPNRSYSFLELMARTRGLHASEPRDYVYALLAHSSAHKSLPLPDRTGAYLMEPTIIIPDYNSTVEEVYTQTTIQVLHDSGNLKLLSMVEHHEPPKHNSLPSWVPNRSLGIDGTPIMFGLSDSYAYDAGPKPASISVQGNNLNVTGILLDTVMLVGPVFTKYDLRPRNQNHDTWNASLNLLRENDTSSPYPDHEAAIAETLTFGMLDFVAAYTDTAQSRANFKAYESRVARVWSGDESAEISGEDQVSTLPAGDADQYFMDIADGCYNRAAFRTVCGRIGMGPICVEPQDICIVLYGAKVPFILRRIPDVADEMYFLIGEAYVPGVMRGEAIGHSPAAGFVERSFVLR